jgi:hypothetical protein
MDDRKFYLGAVVNVVGPRLRPLGAALEAVRDEVEALLAGDTLAGAPFSEVDLTVHVGDRTDLTPQLGSIATGELPVTIELAYESLRALPEPAEFTGALRRAVLEALVAVVDRFGLRAEAVRRARVNRARATGR